MQHKYWNRSQIDFQSGKADHYICNDGFVHQLNPEKTRMMVKCLGCDKVVGSWPYLSEVEYTKAKTKKDRKAEDAETGAFEHVIKEMEHRGQCQITKQ